MVLQSRSGEEEGDALDSGFGYRGAPSSSHLLPKTGLGDKGMKSLENGQNPAPGEERSILIAGPITRCSINRMICSCH
jgi:hypothetical protein